MKKPFANAYEKIKTILKNLFSPKSKTEEGEEAEAATAEGAEAAEGTEGAEAAGETAEAPEAKEEPSEKDKAVESVLKNIASEEGIKEEKVSAGELEEQRKYEEEVKKRAERAAKRAEKDKKEEQGGRKSVDPVTGEEISVGSLPADSITLKKYMRVPTTSDDVMVAISSIQKHPDMPKNIVILGRNGFGTVKVGEDFARSFFKLGIVEAETIAKTKAKQLNNMKNLDPLKKLKGGCLIIENAGLVMFDKLVEVIKDSAPENNDYVVILTGEIDSLANFFEENEDIADSFIYLIDIHKIKERGMVHIGRGYIKEKGYKADKAVSDKLKDSLKSMEEGNIDRFIKLIDDAMEKCDKREAEAGGEAEKLLQPSDVA